VWQNLYFAFKNWDFSILMGLIYWLLAVAVTLRNQWDMYAGVAVIFGWALIGYTFSQEKSRRAAVWISSTLHAAAHTLLLLYSATCLAKFNAAHFALSGAWYSNWLWLGLLLAEMFPIGFLLGSSFFGWNMMLTCRFFRMNSNDAFSALRLGAYNNFVRMKITEDNVEFFVIGLEQPPRRDDWTENPKHGPHTTDQPRFLPKAPLQPHLIETFSLNG
jgi:hypothetical protein